MDWLKWYEWWGIRDLAAINPLIAWVVVLLLIVTLVKALDTIIKWTKLWLSWRREKRQHQAMRHKTSHLIEDPQWTPEEIEEMRKQTVSPASIKLFDPGKVKAWGAQLIADMDAKTLQSMTPEEERAIHAERQKRWQQGGPHALAGIQTTITADDLRRYRKRVALGTWQGIQAAQREAERGTLADFTDKEIMDEAIRRKIIGFG